LINLRFITARNHSFVHASGQNMGSKRNSEW